MGIKSWSNSRNGSCRTVRLGSGGGDLDNTRPGQWRMFWQKIKSKKVFSSTSSTSKLRGSFSSLSSSATSYHPCAYEENFDQGIASREPDNLSRSFSARFADPSIMTRIN